MKRHADNVTRIGADDARSVGMELTLQKLVHRPAFLTYAVEARERTALHSVEARRKFRGGLFLRPPSEGLLDAAERLFTRRLERSSTRSLKQDLARLAPADSASAPAELARPRVQVLKYPFPLAFAKLFGSGASPVNSEIFEGLVQAPAARAAQIIDSLAGRKDAVTSIAYAAASLLPQEAADRLAHARRFAAERLLSRLPVDTPTLRSIRDMCDLCHSGGDRVNEFLALQVLALLGDVRFITDRYVRLDAKTILSLVAISPEAFRWDGGKFQPIEWTDAANASLVIVDVHVPQAMLARMPKSALFTPRGMRDIAAIADKQKLVSIYAAEYSEAEERLCAETERVASALTKSFAWPFKGSALKPLVPLLHETAIRVDDVVFAAVRPLWAAREAIIKRKPKRICIYAESLIFAYWVARLAAEISDDIRVEVRLLRAGDLDDDDIGQREMLPAGDLLGESKRWLRDAGLLQDASRTSTSTPSKSTLFCGRPFDRNYMTDTGALMTLAVGQGRVHLMPAAGARAQDGVKPSISSVLPPSAEFTFWEEPERVSRSLTAGSIPDALKSHGANVVTKLMANEEDSFHLFLRHAEPQLRRLFERVLPAMVLSAAWVRRVVRQAAPGRIVCLPGRDWLSRMAVAEARASLSGKVRSFDIQTVFIGPRRRYKATPCDYQVAIDTYSAQLLHSFFGLPNKRVVVGGSARYAASLKAARAETSQSSRFCILFTASPIIERCVPVAETLAKTIARQDNAFLNIRPHPSTNEKDLARLSAIVAPLGYKGNIDSEGTLAAALASANIVVTRFSNTGLEAAMIGKPVIAADFSGEKPSIPLDKMGVALSAKSARELRETIGKIRKGGAKIKRFNAARAAYFAKNPQLLDEDVAARLWATILRLS